MKELIFYSLSSGSSGNCYYIGSQSKGILIDAGIPARQTRKFLEENNISIEAVMAVLISHNHSDHTRGLEVLARRHHIPVFTTKKVWDSINIHRKNIPGPCIREILLEKEFTLADMKIITFAVSHDAPETIGFHICMDDNRITIATDLGYISETAALYINKARLLVIEANYDETMLSEGRYPYFLKKRISSDQGHLSNKQTSEFLANTFSGNLSHICLAHLSIKNNSPEKARLTLENTLLEKDIKQNNRPEIFVLNRNKPTPPICLTS